MPSGWITKLRRRAIYLRDDFTCGYCGKRGQVNAKDINLRLTIDHITPKHRGGTNKSRNLITCCRRCNLQKGSRSYRGYIAYLSNMLIRNGDRVAQRVERMRKRSMDDHE
jgi:5-methylcytosine-specific restriction endonuclease McrA